MVRAPEKARKALPVRVVAISRLSLDVRDLNGLLGCSHPPEPSTGAGLHNRVALTLLNKSGGAMHRDGTKRLPFRLKHDAELSAADASSICQHGIEYRRQLTGRTRNDAQHLRGRSLLFQRFA